MRCSPLQLHRLALELRDLRSLRDAVALVANDAELAALALDLQIAHAPSEGALSSHELAALIDPKLTAAQLEALELLRGGECLTARATGGGRVAKLVAERLIAAGFARRDSYFVSITRAGRIALDRAQRPSIAKAYPRARIVEVSA